MLAITITYHHSPTTASKKEFQVVIEYFEPKLAKPSTKLIT
jgi:hypothetical protein